ncbi:ferredoxin [Wenjunlia tyrosinilytica]|jgi:ferredoxin|uniref:Ferredoxin n=1 Tax=Wenjunlia tyrosinilytica TaxID=1544741 RepID=A0A918DZH6_9ACTN|nr:ferredoxin [Wenjunlia tyrosinilytica]GGO90135.1 ferredoxin [Wenjunlia tyrosinilytica]
MKVVVDMNKCQDHGQCVFAAPEVFQLDEGAHLVFVGEPDDSLREQVEDAADVCPLQAIAIED